MGLLFRKSLFVYRQSEAGNVMIATKCMPEVVSDSSYDIKEMLELCPDGLPIPVLRGILMRVEFLVTDKS